MESKVQKVYKRFAAYSIDESQYTTVLKKMNFEANSRYVLATNNCGHACAKSVLTIGLDPGYLKSPMTNQFGIPTSSVSYTLSPIPNVLYDQMIVNNPGRLVTVINRNQ